MIKPEMTFKQIVILDKVMLTDALIDNLNDFSENPVKVSNDDPKDLSEIIQKLAGADCALLSWRTPIDKEIIEKCPDLKFICLCATNSNLIDLEACKKKNITVSNIKDYGDEGVVEWVFSKLLNLMKGFGEYQWRDQPCELSGKTIGIIGMGTIGKMIADTALGFNMQVIYYSRSEVDEYEKKGVHFNDKKELLQKSDFITLQTPKNLKILEDEDFKLMEGKVLINNTLGLAFDKEKLIKWINRPNNYLITDKAPDFASEMSNLERVIYSDFVSGLTKEATERLSQKAMGNITEFLNRQKEKMKAYESDKGHAL